MPLLKIAEDKVTDTQEINVKIAENQPQYATLPANYEKGVMTFAFKLDEDDIEQILKEKRIYVLLQTGGNKMQPINVGVEAESFDQVTQFTREQMVPAKGDS